METRTLLEYEAGGSAMPFVINGTDEFVDRDTVWAAHSHPTHELLSGPIRCTRFF